MNMIINKNRGIFSILLILFVAQLSWSQTYTEDETNSSTEATTELNGQQVSQTVFNSFFDTTPNPKLSTVNGNSISLVQVSSNNTALLRVASRASDINILQNGNDNTVGLFYQVDKVVTDVKQNGNANLVLDYVIDPSAEVSLGLEQNGDNLRFERFGANNITKNIKFTQTEASPEIIVRSFN